MNRRSPARVLLLCLFTLYTPVAIADDVADLNAMLDEFLAGASVGDVAVHENFWHDELIYTSSNGTRTNKENILQGIRGAPPIGDEGPSVIYTAEEVDIRLYGDTAIVAFKLVGTPTSKGGPANYYFNTGTFLRTTGTWRVIAWQATIIPVAEATEDP